MLTASLLPASIPWNISEVATTLVDMPCLIDEKCIALRASFGRVSSGITVIQTVIAVGAKCPAVSHIRNDVFDYGSFAGGLFHEIFL